MSGPVWQSGMGDSSGLSIRGGIEMKLVWVKIGWMVFVDIQSIPSATSSSSPSPSFFVLCIHLFVVK